MDPGVLVAIFLWKNVSYNIVLFWSGLNWIPKTYYEQMALEGAGTWKQFWNVTWIYLSPHHLCGIAHEHRQQL